MVYVIPSFSRVAVSLTKIVCDSCPLFSSNSIFAFSTKAGDHQSHRATDWSYQQWGLRSLHVSRDRHICFVSTHWPRAFFLPLYFLGYLKSCPFKPCFNMLTRAFCRINDKGHSRKKQVVCNFREMTQLLILKPRMALWMMLLCNHPQFWAKVGHQRNPGRLGFTKSESREVG